MQGVAGAPATIARDYDLYYRGEIDGDLTKKAIDLIKANSAEDVPFFIYLAYTQTHYPNIASEEFDGAAGNGVWPIYCFRQIRA